MNQRIHRFQVGVAAVALFGLTATAVQAQLSALGGLKGEESIEDWESPPPADEPVMVAAATGPDIITAELFDTMSYGSENGISAFAVGTIPCNMGDEPANWFAGTNQHPVVGQNMFRLKNDRFEQMGMSWLKHCYMALAGQACGVVCHPPDAGGTLLGVGCSSPSSASLHGHQTYLGPRWQINAHTGYFPYPPDNPPYSGDIARRLQVHDTDLDPALNPDAIYFVEGQYVSADEALAGNGKNSVSYRRISISGPDPLTGKYTAGLAGMPSTRREQAAIRAWQDYDPSVVETDVQIPNEGLLILAAKATDLGGGVWQYEYALQNVNSDRSVGSFSVPLPAGVVAEDFGFHDVDYHSGEPWDGTDWPVTVAGGAVTWSTESYATNPDANALRWGTIYNFRFRANVGADTATVEIDLFKPGSPDQVAVLTIGPGGPVDCNLNGIPDECDIDCGSPGGPCDVPDCGQSEDCNINGVLDECEIDENSPAPGGPFFCTTACDPDCNDNGIPDECDIDPADPDGNGQVSPDCNDNGVPDECDPDCDGDLKPDECEITDCLPDDPSCQDCNNNGVPDGCEPDCNGNDVADECDITNCDGPLWCRDCNDNDIPDECDISHDCCEIHSKPGCSNAAVEACVCGIDRYCCSVEWDEICVDTVMDPECGSCDGDENGIPDECGPDCDGDGIPDDRDPDVDNDGVINANDVCYCTPVGAAVDVEGRPLGDIDLDCDTDLRDYHWLQQGFTGPID